MSMHLFILHPNIINGAKPHRNSKSEENEGLWEAVKKEELYT